MCWLKSAIVVIGDSREIPMSTGNQTHACMICHRLLVIRNSHEIPQSTGDQTRDISTSTGDQTLT